MRTFWLLASLSPVLGACVSEVESQALQPHALYVEGSFGYDAEANEAVAYFVDAERYEPTLVIHVRDARYFQAFDDRYSCEVTFVADTATSGGLAAAAWVDDANEAEEDDAVFFGFALPDDVGIESTCSPFDDPAWPEDPVEALVRWQWGLGISVLGETMTDELTAAVEASYGEGVWEAQWEPVVLGGGFHWNRASNVAAGGFLAYDYGFGAAVDEAFAMATDEAGMVIAVPAADVGAGSVPSGVYEIYAWNGIQADLAVE